jgi:hypothetical protein
MRGTIIWHGDRGTSQSPHTSKSVLNGVIGLTEMTTLATGLAAYTDCNRGRASVNDFDSGTPTAPGADVNVDERAVIYMKDTADDSVVSITIPGWDTTTYPLDPATEGDRLVAADVAAIAALVATATGKSLTGLWGKHIKKS